MKQIILLTIAVLFMITFGGAAFSQDTQADAGALMDVIQNGDYDTLTSIVQKLNTSASSGKIKPTDTNMINVVYSLAVLGTENAIKTTSVKAADFAAIRSQATLALGKIGGDYSRAMIIRASGSEIDKKSVPVLTAYMISFIQVGDDGNYDVLSALNYIFSYMPKSDDGDVINLMTAYIQCVDSMTRNTPMPIIARFGIMNSLKNLVNEDTRFPIYSPLVRKPAKAVLTSILDKSI